MKRRVFIGALLAAPLARAQKLEGSARLGILSPVPKLAPVIADSLSSALRRRGWVEGQNLRVEYRSTDGNAAKGLQLAKELVALRVDAVLAFTTATALAMRQVSEQVPVVTWCGYPVEAGLAASLSRPGGNVTGVANYASAEVWGKFLEFLRDLRPGLRHAGALWDYLPPGFPDGLVPLQELESGAQRMGIAWQIWKVSSGNELLEAIRSIDRSPVEALIVTSSGGVHAQPEQIDRIGELIARRRIPAITELSGAVFGGGRFALAYSPNVPVVVDRLGHYVDRVLRGARPRDMPIELPARFDLVLNLKTATELGIAVPQSLRLRADRVIE